jgi:type I restriction enzyme, S subunit
MTKFSPSKEWRLVKLGEVAVRVMEKHEASPSLPERWVGADHLDEGDLRIRRWSMSDDPVFPPTFKFKFPIGAVLIHSRNPKKVAVSEFSAITGEKIFALSSRDDSVLSSQFLALVLQSVRFEGFTNEWMTGSVNKFLNWSALEKFEFRLPPIAEQLRIVELLSAIDRVLKRTVLIKQLMLLLPLLSNFSKIPK